MGSACGACKFLRRKCTNECVFAPHFSYTNASTHFAAVHKVFGASNASKILMNLPLERRSEAAVTISYEALARLHNPVFGCVAHIFALQNQVMSLTEEIEMMGRQLAATIQESNNYYMTSNNNNYLFDNKMNILQHLDIFSSNTGMNLDTSFLDHQTNMNNTQQLMPHHHHLPQAFSDQMINNDTDMDTAHTTTTTYLQNPWILLPNDVVFN